MGGVLDLAGDARLRAVVPDERKMPDPVNEEAGERGQRVELTFRGPPRGGAGKDHPDHEGQQRCQQDQRGKPARQGNEADGKERADHRRDAGRLEAGTVLLDGLDVIDGQRRAGSRADRCGEAPPKQPRHRGAAPKVCTVLRTRHCEMVHEEDAAGAQERSSCKAGEPAKEGRTRHKCFHAAGNSPGKQGRTEDIEGPELPGSFGFHKSATV